MNDMDDKEIKKLNEKIDELTFRMDQLISLLLEDGEFEEDIAESELIQKRTDYMRLII